MEERGNTGAEERQQGSRGEVIWEQRIGNTWSRGEVTWEQRIGNTGAAERQHGSKLTLRSNITDSTFNISASVESGAGFQKVEFLRLIVVTSSEMGLHAMMTQCLNIPWAHGTNGSMCTSRLTSEA